MKVRREGAIEDSLIAKQRLSLLWQHFSHLRITSGPSGGVKIRGKAWELLAVDIIMNLFTKGHHVSHKLRNVEYPF